MRFVTDFTRDEYIDWLMAYKDYSYNDAIKMANIMYGQEATYDGKSNRKNA
jgi:hypothetical protein